MVLPFPETVPIPVCQFKGSVHPSRTAHLNPRSSLTPISAFCAGRKPFGSLQRIAHVVLSGQIWGTLMIVFGTHWSSHDAPCDSSVSAIQTNNSGFCCLLRKTFQGRPQRSFSAM